MNLIANNLSRYKEAAYILFGIILGITSIQSPYLAWLGLLGLLTVVLLSKNPFYALFIFVIFIPYSSTDLFNSYVIDLPGAKLVNILGFLVLAAGLWHYKNSKKLPAYAFYFMTAIFVIFTICFVRSLSHLDLPSERALGCSPTLDSHGALELRAAGPAGTGCRSGESSPWPHSCHRTHWARRNDASRHRPFVIILCRSRHRITPWLR